MLRLLSATAGKAITLRIVYLPLAQNSGSACYPTFPYAKHAVIPLMRGAHKGISIVSVSPVFPALRTPRG